MKITNRFPGKLSFIVLLIFLAVSGPAVNAQIALSFTGLPTVTGSPGTVGATYTYNNIGTMGAIRLRGVFEIISITGNATLANMDLTNGGTDAAWQPIINGSAASGATWGMRFRLSFYNASTGAPVVVSSLTASTIDVDGDGGNLREYVDYYAPTSYTVESPSALSVQKNGSRYRFTSPKKAFQDIDLKETTVNVSGHYENQQAIILELGAGCVGAACSATGLARQYSVNFKDQVVYNNQMIVLPVHLVSLHADKVNGGNKISWVVTEEHNLSRYLVQRSSDGANFDTVHEVPYSGNSVGEATYTYTDHTPPAGLVYYRLSTVDIDGHSWFSGSVKVAAAHDSSTLVITGNPVMNHLRFEYVTPVTQQLRLSIVAENGQQVKGAILNVQKGVNMIEYAEVSDLKKGLYFLIVTDSQGATLRQEWVKM
ncbi:MAG: hypothetical protein EOO09_02625 [Chitinophagaceae bacterium]|nr:MAG: hypothetical protein EOO09_02625 [Chitinophagaceae bacterium]